MWYSLVCYFLSKGYEDGKGHRGNTATTLSGGEAQRVKISSELYRPHVEKTLRNIETNDRCKVVGILDTVVNNKVMVTSEVICTKSGKHVLSGVKLTSYFKKENNQVQAIPPEEYE